jgi:hypothetical protein
MFQMLLQRRKRLGSPGAQLGIVAPLRVGLEQAHRFLMRFDLPGGDQGKPDPDQNPEKD